MKTMKEAVFALGCLLFWAVALPLAGLVEIWIVVADGGGSRCILDRDAFTNPRSN